jgi:hypothetical protein
LGVELADYLFRNVPLGKLDKCESARAAGLAIDRHDDM